jgi:hypothetical protein
MVDPSMLALLAVTPPLLPEIQLSGKIGLQAGTEKLEKQDIRAHGCHYRRRKRI